MPASWHQAMFGSTEFDLVRASTETYLQAIKEANDLAIDHINERGLPPGSFQITSNLVLSKRDKGMAVVTVFLYF